MQVTQRLDAVDRGERVVVAEADARDAEVVGGAEPRVVRLQVRVVVFDVEAQVAVVAGGCAPPLRVEEGVAAARADHAAGVGLPFPDLEEARRCPDGRRRLADDQRVRIELHACAQARAPRTRRLACALQRILEALGGLAHGGERRLRRGVVERGGRLGDVAEHRLREARVVAGVVAERGVELTGARQVGLGSLVVASAVRRHAGQELRPRVVGIDLDHLLEDVAGLGDAILLDQQRTLVEQELGILRIRSDRTVVPGERTLDVALRIGDQCQVVQRGGVAAVLLEHTLEVRGGLLPTLLAVGDHALVEGDLGLNRRLGRRRERQQHEDEQGHRTAREGSETHDSHSFTAACAGCLDWDRRFEQSSPALVK